MITLCMLTIVRESPDFRFYLLFKLADLLSCIIHWYGINIPLVLHRANIIPFRRLSWDYGGDKSYGRFNDPHVCDIRCIVVFKRREWSEGGEERFRCPAGCDTISLLSENDSERGGKKCIDADKVGYYAREAVGLGVAIIKTKSLFVKLPTRQSSHSRAANLVKSIYNSKQNSENNNLIWTIGLSRRTIIPLIYLI